MSNTIVCGVDDSAHSRTAARVAGVLARRLAAPLTLLHVLEPGADAHAAEGIAAAQAAARQELECQPVPVMVRSGPVPAVLAEAGRRAQLLVLGTRGEGAPGRSLLGRVPDAVARNPPCPVVLVPPAAAGNAAPVLGHSVVRGVRDERDASCVDTGMRMAERLDLGCVLAHVAEPPVSAPAPRRAEPSVGRRPDVREHAGAGSMFGMLARRVALAGVDVDVRVLDGAPGPQLAGLAEAADASLVVVGSPRREPLHPALAGSASRYLIHRGALPVVVCPHQHLAA